MTDVPLTRLATVDDVAEVVRLRRALFDSLGESDPGWEGACAAVLERAMAEGWMIVAVVDDPDGGLAAVGSAEIQQRLPGPTKPSGLLGHIGTMSTDPGWRGRGCATAVLERLLAELQARGVERIELHATPMAEGLYRRAGFVDRPGGVELRFAPAPDHDTTEHPSGR